ncbi:MAG: beta-ketoacyl-[acyl-carrier-protein] synthase family protein [Candidatus Aenigmatarchaeota archaeon]
MGKNHSEMVITSIGIVSPFGVGKETFWEAQFEGRNGISEITSFSTDKFLVKLGGELKNFEPSVYLGSKGLRNLNRSTLFLMVASKFAIEEAKLNIDENNTDDIGVCTGTTFSHIWSLIEFEKEVLDEGLDFANPAYFPFTVMNASSSNVSIRFNIQGFNTTIATGYPASLDALKYSLVALETEKAKVVLSGAVDTLNRPLFFGFHRLGYMAGLKGVSLSCPFDKRRNGPLLGEAAVMFCVEKLESTKERIGSFLAKIKSVESFFDGFKIGKIDPQGRALEKVIKEALDKSGAGVTDIDYISSCANSSQDLDKIEVKVLKKIFGKNLKKIPISSIKSMVGETLSASGGLQIVSSIGAMLKGLLPPTINYKEKDPDCDINCVPNKAQKKNINTVLVISFGPGGYHSACILEKGNF